MEISFIISQLTASYSGEPWHGRSITSLLSEVDTSKAFTKPDSVSHSVAELVYHMVNWREFTISRLVPQRGMDMNYFEKNDWRKLDLGSGKTWENAVQALQSTQQQLITALQNTDDSILSKPVDERNYDFRTLLYGILQHDAYHAGQIAYVLKIIKN